LEQTPFKNVTNKHSFRKSPVK